ncbi:MAG: ice-binding family protein [Parcubacteria group bacterium]
MTKKLNIAHIVPILMAVSMGGALIYAASPTTIDLGSAEDFAVLAGSTITNTGSSVINGDLGLSPGTSVTGFPPGVLNGAENIANALAISAKTSLGNAYSDGASRSATTIPTELGGSTRMAGVYDSADGTFGITGTLTLDGEGDPNAVFIFKTSSTLTTAGASSVILTGEAQACNVFWVVGSSATLGENSSLKGSILAQTSITLTTGAEVEGRVLARSGAVTLDSNQVTMTKCDNSVSESTPIVEEEETATTTVEVTATTTVDVTATTTATTTPVVFITPVLAIAPALPDTGFGPPEDSKIPMTAIAVGVLALLPVAYLTRKKYTA